MPERLLASHEPVVEGGVPAPLRGGAAASRVEKFSTPALLELRQAVRRVGTDSFHAAELIISFLSRRGYAVSIDDLRSATSPINNFAASIERMQDELEKLAICM